MKVKIEKEKCIGCGSCISTTDSKVFDFDEEGLSECIIDNIPEDLEEETKKAIEYCPTDAIIEE